MVFVSHDLSAVRRFCDKTVMLKKGSLVAFNDTNEIIDMYIHDTTPSEQINDLNQSAVNVKNGITQKSGINDPVSVNEDKTINADNLRTITDYRWGNKKIEIKNVKLLDKNGKEGNYFTAGEPITISAGYVTKEPVDGPVFGFDIYDDKGNYCYATNSLLKNVTIATLDGEGRLKIKIDELPLLQGKYFVSIAVQSSNYQITYDWQNKKYMFYVINNGNDQGFIRFKCNFEID